MDLGPQTTEEEDAWFAFCFADHDGDSADPDCLLEKAESAVQHAESAARGGPSNVTAGQTGTPILSAHAAVEPGGCLAIKLPRKDSVCTPAYKVYSNDGVPP
ncbi:hypothetical protein ABBQ38_004891 [Trebouxia sp. C0009 RCD-2024]